MVMGSNILAVAVRVLRQLRKDRRFLAISLAMPVVVVFMLFTFFDGVDNPLIDPKRFVVPMGAFLIHFIAYILCAIALVRERTAQTLSRMFINGYQQFEIISGYVLAYTALATIQSLLVLGSLSVMFKLNYNFGTLVGIYLTMWLLAIISIALGILISNFSRNEAQVFPFIPLIALLSVFFSGVILPIEKLPEIVAWMRYITPLYYANAVIQELIKAGSASTALLNAAGLAVYGVIVLALATFTLRDVD